MNQQLAQQIRESNIRLESILLDLNAAIRNAREKKALLLKEIKDNYKEIDYLIQNAVINGALNHNIAHVFKTVCEYYNVSEAMVYKLKPRGNTENIAKKVAIYLCCYYCNRDKKSKYYLPLEQIAFNIGLKKHATMIHAKNTCQKEMDIYPQTKQDVEILREKLKKYFA